MLEDQIASLAELIGKTTKGLLSVRVVSRLQEVLSGLGALTHKNQLSILGSMPSTTGNQDGLLTISNYNDPPGVNTNGYAIRVYHGRVRFDDPVEFTSTTTFTGGTSAVLWGVASANWTNVAGLTNSYVTVNKASDRLGTLSSGTATVYLPRTAEQDPNVRSGDIIAYALDANSVATCVSSYLDSKLTTIKLWPTITALPPGWTEYTGSRGRFIVGYSPGDADFDPILTTGGAKTHLHTAHNAATDIADHAAGTSGPATPATDSKATGIADHAAGTSGSCAPVTDSKATGITIAAHADHTHEEKTDVGVCVATGGPTIYYMFTTGTGLSGVQTAGASASLTHPVTDPNHSHTVTSHTHTTPALVHSDPTHFHTVASHTHTTPALAHSGTLSHNLADHKPPYLTLMLIQRTS